MVIDASLLEVLACPVCHAAFVPPTSDASGLVCSGCSRRYPVVDGIPVLLVDEATTPDASAPDVAAPDAATEGE